MNEPGEPLSITSTRLIFLVCAALSCIPLVSVKYFPMVDLPQHAAQLYLWIHFHDPAQGFANGYEINWFTPYLFGYGLARILTFVTPIRIALELVVTAALLAFPFSLAWLLRRAGRHPAWALIGFPMAYSFSFYWGFVNFLVALPLGLLYLGLVIQHASSPSRRGALAIAAAGCALFFGHVLVLCVIGLAAALWLIARYRPSTTTWRQILLELGPLVAPLPLVAAWTLFARGHSSVANEPIILGDGPLVRLTELPAALLGSGIDREAWWAGIALLLILTGGRLSREWYRYFPFLIAVWMYLLCPLQIFGTAYLYGRFAALVIPFFLLMWEPPASRLRARILIAAIVLLHASWMARLTVRFRGFDDECRSFDRIEAAIEPGSSLLSLNYTPESSWIPGHVVFLQFGAWSQAAKGGSLGFSFARYFPELIRHRPGTAPRMTHNLEWQPERFSWATDGDYDYFLARADADRPPLPFRSPPPGIEKVAQEGPWWLYRRTTKSPTRS